MEKDGPGNLSRVQRPSSSPKTIRLLPCGSCVTPGTPPQHSVTLACEPELMNLLSACDFLSAVVDIYQPLPACDYHSPLMKHRPLLWYREPSLYRAQPAFLQLPNLPQADTPAWNSASSPTPTPSAGSPSQSIMAMPFPPTPSRSTGSAFPPAALQQTNLRASVPSYLVGHRAFPTGEDSLRPSSADCGTVRPPWSPHVPHLPGDRCPMARSAGTDALVFKLSPPADLIRL